MSRPPRFERHWHTESMRWKSEVIREGEFTQTGGTRNPMQSAARDSTGRLWFAMANGVVSLDPEHVHTTSRPPIITIRSISADGHPPGREGTFPPKPQTLTIKYLGVNLSNPEKVVYRYRLDGLDDTWQEVGARSEAIYPHLHPGKFTFRVSASNGDGIWGEAVSAQPFTVLPRFDQTWWFVAVYGLAGIGVLWLILTLRVRYVTANIRVRAEERADERIRIARDLHDTLLQGVQGLLLTFDIVGQKLSADEESRKMLERALSAADRIIVEGRNRVKSLRSEHTTHSELLSSLENVGADLNVDGGIVYRVSQQGNSRTLQAHVVDEVFYIAREAITNAFRHANASKIEVCLNYSSTCFGLLCMDNGHGFEATREQQVSTRAHWGLRGMAERAERIKGRFTCSSAKTGTEIRVEVPARSAYRR
jgi:signal transduction histidine kinase